MRDMVQRPETQEAKSDPKNQMQSEKQGQRNRNMYSSVRGVLSEGLSPEEQPREVHPQQWEAPQGRPSGDQAPAGRGGRCRIQAKAGSPISSQPASRMSAVRVGTVINAIN